MTASPYSDAASILDAAAAGERALGFEAVGDLLIDLGRTTPVTNGEAMRSSAVAAAAAASAPGAIAGITAFAKPLVVMLGLSVLAFAIGISLRSPGGAGTITVRPAAADRVGVERVVDPSSTDPGGAAVAAEVDAAVEPDASRDGSSIESPDPGSNDAPTPPSATAATGPPATAAPTTDAPTTAAPTTDAPTTAAPTTDAPTTAAPTTAPEPVDTTSSTSTTTVAPTTTVPTTTSEAHGNNGNGNGNGVGNGKGNQGSGNGNGGNGNGEPPGE
ncbi:MAG: hypothetical protein R8F63_01255 [Acidimicrobiales bacterium]|nr:hypothetical protein [Acidimicrobiales bacterium]